MSNPQPDLAIHQAQPLRVIRGTPSADAVLTQDGDCYDGFVRTFRSWLGARPLDVSALKDRVAELVTAGHHQAAHNEFYAIRRRIAAHFERSPDAVDLAKRHRVETELSDIRRMVPKADRRTVVMELAYVASGQAAPD